MEGLGDQSAHPVRTTGGPGARQVRSGAVATAGLVVLAATLVLAGLLGAYLRVWIVAHAPVNSDEAVVGLMARNILHGHFSAFFWGQSYGGVEPYVVAPAFALFGQSPLVLNLTPVVLCAGAAVVTWRVGRRIFGDPAGCAAAVLSWVWCESSLWNSTKEYGFHEVLLVIGMLVLLEVVRLADQARAGGTGSLADWACLGALVGVGWWASPEIVYFALPGAVVLGVDLRHRVGPSLAGRAGVAAAAMVVGALPWIVASFADGFATLRASGGSPRPGNGYGDRLSTFFTHVLPMILGLRVEGAGAWEGPTTFGVLAYVVVLACLVAALVVVATRVRASWPLVAVCASFPLLYAAFPSAWFWNDGRYAISLTPVLALVLVGGVWTAAGRRLAVWATAGVLVLASASTLVAFNDGFGALSSPGRLAAWGADPDADVHALSRALDARHVADVYAGYWVAYDLQFTSDGRIAASSTDPDRDPAASRAVRAAKTAGWVFVRPSALFSVESQLGSATDLEPAADEQTLVSWLDRHHVAYRTFDAGGFAVVVPDRNVGPPPT